MTISSERIERIREVLAETGTDAWVLYNFRDLNPIACRILGIESSVHQTRRWIAVIPRKGEGRGLVHAIEPHLASYMPGETAFYSSLEEFGSTLSSMLSDFSSVALEYSPMNALPVVSRVDGGMLELIRSTGVEVRSSGELIARVESRLNRQQIDLALQAGAACRRVMRRAFGLIRDSVASGKEIREYDVVAHILRDLEREGLEPDHEPNCSVNANSANPHYQPTAQKSEVIRKGDFVLLDLWGKDPGRDGVFGDITWTAVVSDTVPDRVTEIFELVRDSRDAALALVEKSVAAGTPVSGADVDRVARRVIAEKGYGDRFIHRTGHSITHELHGAGTNLDALETIDDRPLIPESSFSIEPGVYIPGEFGVRSEIDVVITGEREIVVTSSPAQRQVLALFDDDVLAAEEMMPEG